MEATTVPQSALTATAPTTETATTPTATATAERNGCDYRADRHIDHDGYDEPDRHIERD